METRDLFDIRNRIVVVTGGLGQLGKQFCGELLKRGARVAVFDRAVRSGNTGQFDRRRAEDKRKLLIEVDVTKRRSIEKGLAIVGDHWGIPHALVNNAALDSPPDAPAAENGPFESYPEKSWDDVLNVNTKGVFLCSQVIGGAMAEKERGSIVNICSIYGVVSPDQRIYAYRKGERGEAFVKPVSYSTSKGALLNLTRYLATYWAERKVRVNTLTFGGVFNHQDPLFLDGYCRHVPMGRMAHENEYNGAIVFLVSEASSYMTGANMVIDGGWTAW